MSAMSARKQQQAGRADRQAAGPRRSIAGSAHAARGRRRPAPGTLRRGLGAARGLGLRRGRGQPPRRPVHLPGVPGVHGNRGAPPVRAIDRARPRSPGELPALRPGQPRCPRASGGCASRPPGGRRRGRTDPGSGAGSPVAGGRAAVPSGRRGTAGAAHPARSPGRSWFAPGLALLPVAADLVCCSRRPAGRWRPIAALPARTVYQGMTQVVVQPGQTLWSIACGRRARAPIRASLSSRSSRPTRWAARHLSGGGTAVGAEGLIGPTAWRRACGPARRAQHGWLRRRVCGCPQPAASADRLPAASSA